ncbi:MAG TPA: hypothetical protein VK563_18710 [Puia sp.]|nr:hypothetical protein [Puia sp.]
MKKTIKIHGGLFDQDVTLTYDPQLDAVKPCAVALQRVTEANKRLREIKIWPWEQKPPLHPLP